MSKFELSDEIKTHLIKVLITSVSIIVSVMFLYYTMSPYENCKSLVEEKTNSKTGSLEVCNKFTKW